LKASATPIVGVTAKESTAASVPIPDWCRQLLVSLGLGLAVDGFSKVFEKSFFFLRKLIKNQKSSAFKPEFCTLLPLVLISFSKGTMSLFQTELSKSFRKKFFCRKLEKFSKSSAFKPKFCTLVVIIHTIAKRKI
jgi:hypothetical protein